MKRAGLLLLLTGTLLACKPKNGATSSSTLDDATLEKNAEKWVDQELKPSTLTRDQQLAEMKFFRDAAKPYRGMSVDVVSETLDVHAYESKTLAKAFEEITGIQVKHDIIQEGDLVEKIQTQMQS